MRNFSSRTSLNSNRRNLYEADPRSWDRFIPVKRKAEMKCKKPQDNSRGLSASLVARRGVCWSIKENQSKHSQRFSFFEFSFVVFFLLQFTYFGYSLVTRKNSENYFGKLYCQQLIHIIQFRTYPFQSPKVGFLSLIFIAKLS